MGRSGGLLIAPLLFLAAVVPARAQEMCGLTQITNTGGNSLNVGADIDAVGSRITFLSSANPLSSNGDGNLEVFLWDTSTGFTQITNTTSGSSSSLAINAAGNRIAFQSDADPLGSNGDGGIEVFLWDASAGFTQITNVNSAVNLNPTINAAGNRVTFQSNANPLGSNGDGDFEIFLWDASTGLAQITNSTGKSSSSPAINDVGNRIAFGSNIDGNNEIFLWDTSAGLTQITNTTSGISLLPTIDAAGNRIAFHSSADLLGSNGDGNPEIFLWDASTGFTQITNSTSGNSGSTTINAAGNRIAFHSTADLLGSNGDQNNEVFLASCPLSLAVPAVSPFGLVILAILLSVAAAWTLRRQRESSVLH